MQELKHAIQNHASAMGVEVSSVMDRCVTGSSDSLLLQVRKPVYKPLFTLIPFPHVAARPRICMPFMNQTLAGEITEKERDAGDKTACDA